MSEEKKKAYMKMSSRGFQSIRSFFKIQSCFAYPVIINSPFRHMNLYKLPASGTGAKNVIWTDTKKHNPSLVLFSKKW